jgi:hypothetical protein
LIVSVTLEKGVLEGLFAGEALAWVPPEQPLQQIGRLLELLGHHVVLWQDFLEVALGYVVELVHQLDGVLSHLLAHGLEFLGARQPKDGYLLDKLGALGLPGEKGPQGEQLGEYAPDCYKS